MPAAFDDQRGGLGLAPLPIARRVIERHGGRVWTPAQSDGADSHAAQLHNCDITSHLQLCGSMTVEESHTLPSSMTIRDSPIICASFLSLRGLRDVIVAQRGDEMIAAVKQGDPPDIVLLDVMMPGMNGLETLRALKAAKPEMQVIMLSGREQAATIVEAVRLGAADYVVKPDDPEGLGEIALDAAIKSAIEKTRLVSEITELRRQLSDDQDRAFLFWGDSPEMQIDRDGHRAGVRQRRHRADSRRERRRQGARGARDPSALAAQEPAVREGQLRGAAGRPARKRAVRAREGAFTGAATTRIGKFEQADTGHDFPR